MRIFYISAIGLVILSEGVHCLYLIPVNEVRSFFVLQDFRNAKYEVHPWFDCLLFNCPAAKFPGVFL